jgi:hypothetical protein
MKIKDSWNSLVDLMKRLDTEKKVFFSRFGDNDIMMMSGTDMNNNPLGDREYGGNKTVYSPELSNHLKKSFQIKDPNYLLGVSLSWDDEPGMDDGVFRNFNYKGGLANKIKSLGREEDFLLPVLFHYLICFNPELFEMFVDRYIKGKRILYIGAIPKQKAEKILGPIAHYVKTPEKTAYNELESFWVDIHKIVTENDVDIVIPSCGQCSRVIQGRLWEIDKDFHSIDMGSLFDVFEDRFTRTWIKKVGNRVRRRYGVHDNYTWNIPVEKEAAIESERSKPRRTKKLLAILIPTLEDRRQSFRVLTSNIAEQLERYDLNRDVDMYKTRDDGTKSIGYKRNWLMSLTENYEYIVFFDDDDQIKDNAIKLIVDALNQNEGVDCVTYKGIVTIDGKNPQDYVFGLEHKSYFTTNGTYYRPPGHICVIKREIMAGVRFQEREKMHDRGTDVSHCLDMVRMDLIKTSVHIDEYIYFYQRKLTGTTGYTLD